MRLPKVSFISVLFLLGAIMAGVMIFDLFFRGPRIYPIDPVWETLDGDAQRGRIAFTQYGCGSCHVAPGIRGANGRVGPQLTGFREQVYVAGQLPNTPENVVKWIKNPQEVAPGTAMPNLNVTDTDARDITAYLFQNP